MTSFRALCNGVAWGFTTVGTAIRTVLDLSYRGCRGIKRSFEAPADDATEAPSTITTIITDDETHTPRAIEERSELPDGSVKRRRLCEDEQHQYIPGQFEPTLNDDASRQQRLSPTPSGRASRQPRSRQSPPRRSNQASRFRTSPTHRQSAQRDTASTDYTAGITWSFQTSRVTARFPPEQYEVKLPGTLHYNSKYDLVQKPDSRKEAGPIRSRAQKSQSRSHPYRKEQSFKPLRKPTSQNAAVSTLRQTGQEEKKLTKEAAAILQEDVDQLAEERKHADDVAARQARIDQAKVQEDAAAANVAKEHEEQEEKRKAQEKAEEQERLKREAAEAEAKVQATENRRAARRAAHLLREDEVARRQAEKSNGEKDAFESRTALFEEEEDDATDRSPTASEAASPEIQWSPREEADMANLMALADGNMKINEFAARQQYLTPEVRRHRAATAKQVRMLISPNSGLDAVNHKIYDQEKPANQLISPEESFSRKDTFFVREFDHLIRDGPKHPVSITTREAYGLNPQYDEIKPSDAVEGSGVNTDMKDASPLQLAVPGTSPIQSRSPVDIEMPDASPPQVVPGAYTGILATWGLPQVNGVGASVAAPYPNGTILGASSLGPQTFVSSSDAAVGTSSSDTGGQSDGEPDFEIDPEFEIYLSSMSLHKRTLIRNTRIAAEAARKAAEEAAAAKAKAEEEERARFKLEEEARAAEEARLAAEKAAEEERNSRRARYMPREKFIQPLSQDWERRLKVEMNRGPHEIVVTTPECDPPRVSLLNKDFGTVLGSSGRDWATEEISDFLNDEIINAYLRQAVREANENAGTRKYATSNSYFYTSLAAKGALHVRRWMKKLKVEGEKLLNLEAIFFPVCQNYHWTLIVLSPRAKTIEYFDSLRNTQPAPDHIVNNMRAFLAMELGALYKAEEWTVPTTPCAKQRNGWDCGVFTITNAKCITLGIDPTCYSDRDMGLQRRRIAAELINGGSV